MFCYTPPRTPYMAVPLRSLRTSVRSVPVQTFIFWVYLFVLLYPRNIPGRFRVRTYLNILLPVMCCVSYSSVGMRWADSITFTARLNPLAYANWLRLASLLMNLLTSYSRPVGSYGLYILFTHTFELPCSRTVCTYGILPFWPPILALNF